MRLHGHLRARVGTLDIDVAVDVAPGSTTVVIGPNGAGKTSVLRLLAGLAPLDEGRLVARHDSDDTDVVWDDPTADVFVPPHQRRVAMMFQQHALIPHLDVRGNVAFGCRARGVSRGVAERSAAAALDRVGLAHFGSRAVAQLSGGEAQRVALARALAAEPAMLLLDEPLAAIDARARPAMRRLLTAADMPTRIIVTHDPVDALTLADQVVVIDSGRVVQAGPPHSLVHSPQSTYVAEILGLNPLAGTLTGNRLMIGTHELTVGAHSAHDGDVVAVVRPRSVSLHRSRPEGSPRNVWSTRIDMVERAADRVRVRLGMPLPLVVEVTEAGLSALGADIGDEVWAAVKASEITVIDR